MSENIKNQFNESTLNYPVFHIADGRQGPNKLLNTASAAVPASFLGRKKELTDIRGLLTRRNTLALVNAEGGMGKPPSPPATGSSTNTSTGTSPGFFAKAASSAPCATNCPTPSASGRP